MELWAQIQGMLLLSDRNKVISCMLLPGSYATIGAYLVRTQELIKA